MASKPQLSAVPDELVSLSIAALSLAALTDALSDLPGADDVKLSFDGAAGRIDVMVVMQTRASPEVAVHLMQRGLPGYRFEQVEAKPFTQGNPTQRWRKCITAIVRDAA